MTSLGKKSAVCLLLVFGLLTGCGRDETVPVTAEPSDEIKVTEASDESPWVAGPTESAEPDEQPTEPVPIRNRDDTFVEGEITVNNSSYRLSEARDRRFRRVINQRYFRYYDKAFYVIDLKTQMSIGYQADQYFSPACTRKAGFALAWYMQLEENRIKNEQGTPLLPGEERVLLTDLYYYDGTDYMDGAGIIARSGYGSYTIGDLLHYMLFMSDNTAYKALWRILGTEKYIALEQELGIPEFYEPSRRNQLWTPMRAQDIGLIWQRIWEYKQSGSPEAELFWYELTHNELCEIGKTVDADEIAHKSGSDEYGFHDAGVVVHGENAYAVVALSKIPLSLANDDDDCIHAMFKELDRFMQEYYELTKNGTDM